MPCAPEPVHLKSCGVNGTPQHKDYVMIASCMNDRARRTAREKQLSSRLSREWSDNQADMYTLDEKDLTTLWVGVQEANGLSLEETAARFEELTGNQTLNLGERTFEVINLHGATAINAGNDGRMLMVLGRDMQRSGNLWARFNIRPHNGQNYIVFKGNHRLRQGIRGTRYGLSKPNIIKPGDGTHWFKSAGQGAPFKNRVRAPKDRDNLTLPHQDTSGGGQQ